MSEPVDVTQVDGPFSPERTNAAARLAADAIRYLNHATAQGSGAGHASDVWDVLGSLGVAVGRLRQTFDQLGRTLEADLATGRLRIDEGTPYAEDPQGGVHAARWQLRLVSDGARELELGIAEAQRLIFGMSLEPKR
ncbi:MAG: hypothetical protein J2P43_00245 [Candidatus Dormibacteraeota bacterium]|nr:hypothetical protein [Candidatus Dormibacteraeota bacterium]